MKEQRRDRSLVLSDGVETTSFGIANEDQARILEILRDKIYSNKPLAVIREYSSNAYDANIEAGKSHAPITVHLPTNSQPYFSVLDIGQGLTEEEIRNTYVMYGKSSKRGTNTQVGMLGLGNKSAFAYTDSFTIKSRQSSRQDTYVAAIDETGLGTISKLSSSVTDKPDGITVVIPVRREDIPTFIAQATVFYDSMRPYPKLNVDLPALGEVILRSNDNSPFYWRIQKVNVASISILMGCVPYPLNIDSPIGKKLLQVSSLYASRWPYRIIIEVPIGSVDIAASREGLEYTERTEKLLSSTIDKFTEDVENICRRKVAEQETFFKAHQARDKYWKTCFRVTSRRPVFEWGHCTVEDCIVKKSHSVGSKIFEVSNHDYTVFQVNNIVAPRTTAENLVIIEKDEHTYWKKRVKKFAEENPKYQVVIIESPTQEGLKKLVDKFSLKQFPYRKISSLPKPKIKRSKSEQADKSTLEKYKRHIFLFKRSRFGRKASDFWETPSTLPEGEKIYVVLNRFHFKDDLDLEATYRPPRSLNREIDTINDSSRDNEQKVTEIYGIKRGKVELITKKDNWISLEEFRKRQVEGIIEDAELMAELRETFQYKEGSGRDLVDVIEICREHIKADSPIIGIYDRLNTEPSARFLQLKALLEKNDIALPQIDPVHHAEQTYPGISELLSTYRALWRGWSINPASIGIILNIIHLINRIDNEQLHSDTNLYNPLDE